MIKFKLNKEKSDIVFNVFECQINKHCRVTMIEDTVRNTYWVYVRKEVYDWNNYLWYIEVSNNNVNNQKECKQAAEKMIDIVNGYKPPLVN